MFPSLLSLSPEMLDWLKSLCIDVYLVATFGVVVGVYWERDSAPESVKHEGWTLLVRSLAIELLVGAFIFAIDAEISHRQQSKIVALLRIAPRILSSADENRIRDKVKPFGPLVVAVGSTTPLTHTLDIDSLRSQLAGVFSMPGWRSNGTWTGGDNRPLGVWVSARAGDTRAKAAAEILAHELNIIGIVAHIDPKPFAGPKPPRPPDPPPLPPAPYMAVVTSRMAALSTVSQWELLPDMQVVVGVKP